MKLTKRLFGVANGEIYPRFYEAGEECPSELEEAAHATGAFDCDDDADEAPERRKPGRPKKVMSGAPETK